MTETAVAAKPAKTNIPRHANLMPLAFKYFMEHTEVDEQYRHPPPAFLNIMANSLNPNQEGHGKCIHIHREARTVIRFPEMQGCTEGARSKILRAAMDKVLAAKSGVPGGGEKRRSKAENDYVLLCHALALWGQVATPAERQYTLGVSMAPTAEEAFSPQYFWIIPMAIKGEFMNPQLRAAESIRHLIQMDPESTGIFFPTGRRVSITHPVTKQKIDWAHDAFYVAWRYAAMLWHSGKLEPSSVHLLSLEDNSSKATTAVAAASQQQQQQPLTKSHGNGAKKVTTTTTAVPATTKKSKKTLALDASSIAAAAATRSVAETAPTRHLKQEEERRFSAQYLRTTPWLQAAMFTAPEPPSMPEQKSPGYMALDMIVPDIKSLMRLVDNTASSSSSRDPAAVRFDTQELATAFMILLRPLDAAWRTLANWLRQQGQHLSTLHVDMVTQRMYKDRNHFRLSVVELATFWGQFAVLVRDMPELILNKFEPLIHTLRSVDKMFAIRSVTAPNGAPFKCLLTRRYLSPGIDECYALDMPNPEDATRTVRFLMCKTISLADLLEPPVNLDLLFQEQVLSAAAGMAPPAITTTTTTTTKPKKLSAKKRAALEGTAVDLPTSPGKKQRPAAAIPDGDSVAAAAITTTIKRTLVNVQYTPCIALPPASLGQVHIQINPLLLRLLRTAATAPTQPFVETFCYDCLSYTKADGRGFHKFMMERQVALHLENAHNDILQHMMAMLHQFFIAAEQTPITVHLTALVFESSLVSTAIILPDDSQPQAQARRSFNEVQYYAGLTHLLRMFRTRIETNPVHMQAVRDRYVSETEPPTPNQLSVARVLFLPLTVPQ